MIPDYSARRAAVNRGMRGLAVAMILALSAGFLAPQRAICQELASARIPRFADPKGVILVVYLHSSLSESETDICAPNNPDSPGGVLPIVQSLDGTTVGSKTIEVFAFCGDARLGSFDGTTGTGEPKVLRRTQEVEALLRNTRAHYGAGLRIFLIGHSAGGWVALLAARHGAARPDGIVALAPAFAGPRADRTMAWQALRERQARLLSSATSLNALVYAFEGDAYEPPNDLAFLSNIAGVNFRALPSDEIDGHRCRPARPHNTAALPCFRDTQRDEILKFLAR